MTSTAIAHKDQLSGLKGIFDVDNLLDTTFFFFISSISESEADKLDFKSLKGIAGKPLNLDDVRAERLHL